MKFYRPLTSLLLASTLLVAPAVWAQGPQVTSIELTAGDNEMGEVIVELDGVPTYTARVDEAAKRLLIDLNHASIKGAAPALVESKGVVGGVMAQTFGQGDQARTRLVISLLKEAQYSIAVEQNRLTVRFEKGPLQVLSGLDARLAAPNAPETATPGEVVISDVRFEHKTGRDIVDVELDSRARFSVDNKSTGRSVLTIRGATLPTVLQRTLDVGDFGGYVEKVSSFRDKNSVIIEVQHEPKATSSVKRSGNTLRWLFYEPGSLPSSLTGTGSDGLPARKSRPPKGQSRPR